MKSKKILLAANYYVSQTLGDDNNDGSIETPFKTLEKINSMEFAPGDMIFLYKGDTWNEKLNLKGMGDSLNWITITSYGEGEKPVISPGPDQPYAILMENVAGWKIVDISVGDAQQGIVYQNSTLGTRDGLWLEDVFIHGITGAHVIEEGEEPDPDGYYMSYGVLVNLKNDVERLTNMTVKNCYIENTDCPMTIRNVNNLEILDCTFNVSYRAGVTMEEVNRNEGDIGIMDNCKVFTMGSNGMYWGTTGVQFSVVKYFTLSNSEIAYTKSPGSPDGIGVDYEGNNVSVTTQNCHIHDNDSSAFLIYKNPDWGSDNIDINIIGNNMVNNGLKTSSEPAFMRHYYNLETTGIVSGNTIVMRDKNQSLNYSDLTGNTQEWVGNYTYSNNEVIEGGGNTVYNSVIGFSKTENTGMWTYAESLSGVYQLMTVFDEGQSAWKGTAQYAFVGDSWQHPDVDCDSIRTFTAPEAGTYLLKTIAHKADANGDGIILSIYRGNGQMILDPTLITTTDELNTSDEIILAEGEQIHFNVNANADPGNDWVSWIMDFEVLS